MTLRCTVFPAIEWALTINEIIPNMKAWMFAEDAATPPGFPIKMVYRREEAVELAENNAHEVMRAAEINFPAYRWAMVKLPNSNAFVVEGDKK